MVFKLYLVSLLKRCTLFQQENAAACKAYVIDAGLRFTWEQKQFVVAIGNGVWFILSKCLLLSETRTSMCTLYTDAATVFFSHCLFILILFIYVSFFVCVHISRINWTFSFLGLENFCWFAKVAESFWFSIRLTLKCIYLLVWLFTAKLETHSLWNATV